MSLDLLQLQFQQYLIKSDIDPILTDIAEDPRLPAQRRLKIYHDAYRLRLLDILMQDFTKTHTLLGDDEFEKAFFAYLDQYPSTHFSVRYFGQHFSHFLFNTAPYKDYPVLGEMALFEWLVGSTIDAADLPILTVAQLREIPFEQWPELTFTFHPCVISHYFHYDTPQLWQDIEKELAPRQPERQASPLRWIFYRKEIRSFFLSCSPVEDKIFQAILAGKPFAEICEALMDDCPEAEIPMLVAQTLYKWVNEEMVTP